MRVLRAAAVAASIAASFAIALDARQAPAQGGGRVGGAAPAGQLIGGTLTPAKADARGWGWQVKASMNPSTPRPLYMVQNGPARDGWTPPRGGGAGRGAAPGRGGRSNAPAPDTEPVIGLPGGQQPGTSTPAGRGGRGQ